MSKKKIKGRETKNTPVQEISTCIISFNSLFIEPWGSMLVGNSCTDSTPNYVDYQVLHFSNLKIHWFMNGGLFASRT